MWNKVERCKVRALLKTADCGEIYSKINSELEFNVGYYSKQGEEDKVNEGDEELFSKDLRIKNYDKNKSIFK